MRNLSISKAVGRTRLHPKTRFWLLAAGFVGLLVYAASSELGTQASASTQSALVSGLIVDAHGGKAIPMASVLVRNARVPAAHFSRADSEGRFSVEREGAPGLVEIIAYAYGYGIGVKRYRLESGERLQHLLFLLEPAAELRGKVVDRFSDPIAGARIEVAYSRPLSRLSMLDLGTSEL